MSVFYCLRCDKHIDSDFIDSVQDPTNPNEMIDEGCLTEEEILEKEA